MVPSPPLPPTEPSKPSPPPPPIELLRSVSRRLFTTLIVVFGVVLAIVTLAARSPFVVPAVVIGAGLIGGFVGLQRRLKDLTLSDLQLINDSWLYTALSPLVGGILALLLYILFLSGLVSGQLFPIFEADPGLSPTSFSSLFMQHATEFQDYAKLLFWCFVAGFSEHFVTDVINRFQGPAVKNL